MTRDEINSARSLFPCLQKGTIYFNHASSGPLTTRHVETMNSLLYEKSEGSIDDYEELIKVADETKRIISKMINTSKDRIAFTSNTSSGLNILAQGIRWEKGDRIVLNDVEFPANVYPFMNLKEKGVEIDFVKSHNGVVTEDDLINAITRKTRLISVSQVQFLSGYKIGLENLGKVCKEKNIILTIDAIQGLGAVCIDVQKSKIDFLSCGAQKWMLGLQGMAFVYVSEELQNKMYTVPAGWLSVEGAWNLIEYDLKLKKTANRYQAGTLNTFGVYTLNASVKLFDEIGFDRIEEQVLDNSIYFIDKLEKQKIEPILSGFEMKNLAGIVSIKRKDSGEIFKYLNKKNIISSLREGILRFSPHFYNTKDEIDKVVAELRNYSNIYCQ
jgi:selenocysteine lyase/cysteine desulfurase